MKAFFFSACLLLFSSIGFAQKNGISELNDEFNDSTSLRHWKLFNETEKFPSKIKVMGIDQQSKGSFYLEPVACGWYADFQAPFMYKEWEGDFDVRTRIKVSGKNSEGPSLAWSLAGLMVRKPKTTTMTDWKPQQENWLLLTTGVMEPVGDPAFETKTTVNSRSDLRKHPAKTGWLEIRIVHIGEDFVLLNRYEKEDWQVLRIFNRPDLKGKLQIGFNAYTGWNEMPAEYRVNPQKHNETVLNNTRADVILQADYIRFTNPVISAEQLRAKGIDKLTSPELSAQQITSLLGN